MPRAAYGLPCEARKTESPANSSLQIPAALQASGLLVFGTGLN